MFNNLPSLITNKLKPYFGWVNEETIKKTFENSTQWAGTSTRFPMRKHFKSRFPAFNIPRRNEAVATDTIFSDTPAVDSGITMAQVFLLSDVYTMQSSKKFVNTLVDNIRFRRAMSSNKVKNILRMYHSSSWHSEPIHQKPNLSEWCYHTIKAWTTPLIDVVHLLVTGYSA